MKNNKRKINYKDNSKIEIEINKDKILIEQNQVPLRYKKKYGSDLSNCRNWNYSEKKKQ